MGSLCGVLQQTSFPIFKAQKGIVRTIFQVKKRDSCMPLFKRLDNLSLPSMYIYEIVNVVPTDTDTFEIYRLNRPYRTRCIGTFSYPTHITSLYGKCPKYMGLKILNKLQQQLNFCQIHPEIKNMLKTKKKHTTK